MAAHSVYRMFDADGHLLYIGCTALFKLRMKNHRCTKSWWGDVDSVTQEHYAEHREAYRAEAAAIAAERPRYNSPLSPAEWAAHARAAKAAKRAARQEQAA